MAGMSKSVGDIVVPTAQVDVQLGKTPPALAYRVSAIAGTGLTGATEPSWTAPYQGSGTAAQAGGFIVAGAYNGKTLYVNIVAGTPWYLWWDGATTWTVSLVPGTAGAENFTLVNATPVGAYTYGGVIVPTPTLTIAAGSATVTDNQVTWTAIAF
jgi:hypothetical protein